MLLYFFKKTKVCHLLRILIFILFLYFFVTNCSIAINIRNRCLHELNNLSFTITRKLNSSFFTVIFNSSHNFLKRFKDFIMLCSLKCNVFKDFEANMNIMYQTAKNIAIEEKIEIIIFENLMNENIFKLSDLKMIIILIKIV